MWARDVGGSRRSTGPTWCVGSTSTGMASTFPTTTSRRPSTCTPCKVPIQLGSWTRSWRTRSMASGASRSCGPRSATWGSPSTAAGSPASSASRSFARARTRHASPRPSPGRRESSAPPVSTRSRSTCVPCPWRRAWDCARTTTDSPPTKPVSDGPCTWTRTSWARTRSRHPTRRGRSTPSWVSRSTATPTRTSPRGRSSTSEASPWASYASSSTATPWTRTSASASLTRRGPLSARG